MAATTEEELQPLVADAFLYALSQHWIVPLVSSNTQCVVWQPYIKGYGGQVLASSDFAAAVRARVWIDSALKTSMGR